MDPAEQPVCLTDLPQFVGLDVCRLVLSAHEIMYPEEALKAWLVQFDYGNPIAAGNA